MFPPQDRCFYVAQIPQLSQRRTHQDIGVYIQEKTAAGNVTFSRLTPNDQTKFKEARGNEAWGLREVGAVKILSLKDSNDFNANTPDFVLDSLWVERWKSA